MRLSNSVILRMCATPSEVGLSLGPEDTRGGGTWTPTSSTTSCDAGPQATRVARSRHVRGNRLQLRWRGESAAKNKKKVTLCLNGQALPVKRSKRGSFFKHGAMAGACAASPPASPSPSPVSPPLGHPPLPAATCTDGVANGSETDVNGGGPNCPRCENTFRCIPGGDCRSGVCFSGVCVNCISNNDCGDDPNECFCHPESGNCVSNAHNEDAPIRQDCDCAPGFTCVTSGENSRCLPPCGGSEDCGGEDLCKGQRRGCERGGNCVQPLGGGPTRCGESAGFCSCTSHQQCEEMFGFSAFCVTFTENPCTCGGPTTFCALPR
jgi:hypothetical protein